MRLLLFDLYADEQGFIVSAELVLISTLLILGLVTGLACVQAAVNGEFQDFSSALRGLNQSYVYKGFHGCCNRRCCGFSSWTAGSSFIQDGCETAQVISYPQIEQVVAPCTESVTVPVTPVLPDTQVIEQTPCTNCTPVVPVAPCNNCNPVIPVAPCAPYIPAAPCDSVNTVPQQGYLQQEYQQEGYIQQEYIEDEAVEEEVPVESYQSAPTTTVVPQSSGCTSCGSSSYYYNPCPAGSPCSTMSTYNYPSSSKMSIPGCGCDGFMYYSH
jgi:Flp pilus assembly pilin Flp